MYWAIGLPRTGTRSLCEALKVLNLKFSHHNPKILEALDTWVPQTDVIVMMNFNDFPYMDEIYPNSKFIFTDRDDESWLKSCSSHYGRFPIPMLRQASLRKYWRLRAFGSITPTPEQFMAAMQKQRQLVDEYFSSQPERLLRLNICGGEGWDKLCPFLNMPIPDQPFPRVGSTDATLDNMKNRWLMEG